MKSSGNATTSQNSTRATYQDVLDAPPNMVAEILDGTFFLNPRQAMPHTGASSDLFGIVSPPFRFGQGGSGDLAVGHRLSKIYTKTGDDGTTGLGDGSRIEKDSNRIEAIGQLDELNSFIGVTLANELPENVRSCLDRVQHTLLDIGGELAVPGFDALVTAENVKFLENHLDQFNGELSPLKEFILPGGVPAAADCHVARTVCRRVERRLNTLAKEEEVSQYSRQYVNRLSDLLFVAARYINLKGGDADVLWDHDRTKKKFKNSDI